MKRLIVLFVVLAPFMSFSQEWQWLKSYDFKGPVNNAYPASDHLEAADNGQYYLTIDLDTASCLLKYNSEGKEIWRNYIKGDLQVKGISSISNRVYVGGQYQNTVQLQNIALSSSESTVHLQTTDISSNGSTDIFLASYDTEGNLMWVRSMGGPGEDFGNGICTDRYGRAYLTGGYADSAYFGNIQFYSECSKKMFVAGFDLSGNVDFFKSGECKYSENSFAIGYKIKVDAQGDMYCYGNYSYFILDSIHLAEGGGPYPAYFLTRMDSTGKVKWAKPVPNHTILHLFDMALDASGNILLNGYSHWTSGGGTLTFKYNAEGSLVWTKGVGGSCYGGQGISNNIAMSGNDSYILGRLSMGYCWSTGLKFLLVKYDEGGKELLKDTINVQNFWPIDIMRDSNGDFLIAGRLDGPLKLGNESVGAGSGKLIMAKFKESSINIGIKEPELISSEMKIFPNPCSDKLRVSADFKEKCNLKLRILNLNGQLLYAQEKIVPAGNFIKDLDLAGYNMGIYTLEITSESGRTVKKLVIE